MDIVCRAPQDIADDELSEAHDMCVEALRVWVPSIPSYLYTGAKREQIRAHKDKLESLILNGGAWDARVNVLWFTARYIAT
jgi:hypothetical protein